MLEWGVLGGIPASVMLKIAQSETAKPRRLASRSLTARRGFGCLAIAAALFGGSLSQAHGQLSVVISTNYYTVTGNSISELWEAMVQARPWTTNLQYNARTDWATYYSYTYRFAGDQFSFRNINVYTKVSVYLPRWTPPPQVDSTLVEAWAQFLKAVALHETGHISVARLATTELRRQLLAIPAQDSADELQAAADSAARRTLNNYRRMDVEYDQQTRHGITQGAVLRWPPLRRGPPRWAMGP